MHNKTAPKGGFVGRLVEKSNDNSKGVSTHSANVSYLTGKVNQGTVSLSVEELLV